MEEENTGDMETESEMKQASTEGVEFHKRSMFELRCAIREYKWGKMGLDSVAAQLGEAGPHQFKANPDVSYAELWMGSHMNAPSFVITPGDEPNPNLGEWLRHNSQLLGDKVLERYGYELPFLFKVLSIRTALSIQAHPNKKHAEKLHATRPDIYMDPNHKPEMAIALTEFHCLVGFRSVQSIAKFIKLIPELYTVIGRDAADKLIVTALSFDHTLHQKTIKACLVGVMGCAEETIRFELTKFVKRVKKMDYAKREEVMGRELLLLHNDYPGDIGCFIFFFLNYLKLKPGEVVFLNANLPHAYLSGDCMECMSCSDNVVRAGLTAKYIDKVTLLEMLDYTPHPPEELYLRPHQRNERKVIFNTYKPPIQDFAVVEIKMPQGIRKTTLDFVPSPRILCVIQGSGELMTPNIKGAARNP